MGHSPICHTRSHTLSLVGCTSHARLAHTLSLGSRTLAQQPPRTRTALRLFVAYACDRCSFFAGSSLVR